MLVQQPSPEDLYSAFATNVTTIHSDVKDFSITFRNSVFQEILQKAEKSRAESKEDIPSWRVTEHEDWLDVRGADTSMDSAMGGTNGAAPDPSQEASTELEFLHATTKKFNEENPNIDISLNEKSKTIKVWIFATWAADKPAKISRCPSLLRHVLTSRSCANRLLGEVLCTQSQQSKNPTSMRRWSKLSSLERRRKT